MPRGDRTGPEGEGPRTGRALGFCAGYEQPGFASPPGRGLGRGFRGGRGGGRGRRQGRGFVGGEAPQARQADLREQMADLEGRMRDLQQRIEAGER